ncbi:MAG TPA: M2 family metallopeptidase, partial [Blastocatellia bacterium]|nr:M2 family metallopeptidase [Blastocatellia bacterium]
MKLSRHFLIPVTLFSILCLWPDTHFAQSQNPAARPGGAKPTVADAEKFMQEAEKRLAELNIKAERADWVNSTFITDDTDIIAADARKEYTAAVTELAEAARKFDGLKLPYDLERKFKLLKLALTLPAPSNPAERDELTKISVEMKSAYGKGKYCPEGEQGKCLTLNDMERILATSRDPQELKKVWLG